MSRRIARELAVQTLFQKDFCDDDCNLALSIYSEENKPLPEKSMNYLTSLVEGTKQHLLSIDSVIAEKTRTWNFERINPVDKNILRLAIYEMLFAPELIKPNIAINEAIEIAKVFGGDKSANFINGILGKLASEQSG